MAFSFRLLSKSNQLYASRAILQQQHAVPVRYFAKEAGRPTVLKGDEMLKNIFLEVKKKFESALDVLRKEKITIDPEDPAAVAEYAKVMKKVREKNRARRGRLDVLVREADSTWMNKVEEQELRNPLLHHFFPSLSFPTNSKCGSIIVV